MIISDKWYKIRHSYNGRPTGNHMWPVEYSIPVTVSDRGGHFSCLKPFCVQ